MGGLGRAGQPAGQAGNSERRGASTKCDGRRSGIRMRPGNLLSRRYARARAEGAIAFPGHSTSGSCAQGLRPAREPVEVERSGLPESFSSPSARRGGRPAWQSQGRSAGLRRQSNLSFISGVPWLRTEVLERPLRAVIRLSCPIVASDGLFPCGLISGVPIIPRGAGWIPFHPGRGSESFRHVNAPPGNYRALSIRLVRGHRRGVPAGRGDVPLPG